MSLTKNEIKLIKSLQIKKYRDNHQLFVIEGEKMVSELFNQDRFIIDTVFYTSDYPLEFIPTKCHSVQISNNELGRISGLKTPNKVLATVKMGHKPEINFNEENLVLLLDDVKDPGNLGTIIRTADWFGIKQIIASKKTVDLFNSKTLQSSMGAIYRMNFFYEDLFETVNDFKNNDFIISGASLTGDSIYEATFTPKTALIMGSESHGISDEINELLDQKLLIPQYGETESLNVAIATGILIGEYCRNTK